MKTWRIFSLLAIFAIAPLVASAQSKAPHADSIMSIAYRQATQSNKKVFLMFHASWCGWCKKMDKTMQDESIKAFFDKHFVIVHLTVEEGAGKAHLENEGGAALKEKFLGKGQGLPYWVVLDNTGKLLADSQMRKAGAAATDKGENIGCPASKGEVAAFIEILKKTTTLSTEDLDIISKQFRKNGND